MNKNPFVPTPSYTPHQPPLPPGPPPTQPADYSAYWVAHGAQQPAQPIATNYQPYNGQWTAPQPAPPSQNPQQSALFANYGYGAQQAHQHQQWQHQQQQQQQRPPQPMYPQMPPAPPAQQMQQAYNPYQPQMPYQPQQSQYPPQPAPQQPQPLAVQPSFPAPTQAPPQAYFPQPPAPMAGPMQNGIHHTPPQNLPPAKRQRFDRPNNNGPRPPPVPQPQFGSAPPPGQPGFMGAQPMAGGPLPMGRGGAPGITPMGSMNANMSGMGGGRGNGGMGRGGAPGMRGGKPSFPNAGGGRGGMASGHRGGRGGGSFNVGGGGGRGGAPGPGGGPLRAHGSHNGFGGGQGRRGGGSFNTRGPGQQTFTPGGPGGSFRGRGGGQGHHGRVRHDAYGGAGGPVPLGPSASMNSAGSSRKEENRRTLTDFKIVGMEIPELSWSWGILPPPKADEVVKEDPIAGDSAPPDALSREEETVATNENKPVVDESTTGQPTNVKSEPTDGELTQPATDGAAPADSPASPTRSKCDYDRPPPSRMRIYFHTPVTPDDARPIPYNNHGAPNTPDGARKGKRKKGDDDSDDDAQHARARPPPGEERGSVVPSTDMERSSVAPSVAETASEVDWLMAALAEGSAQGDEPEEGNEGEDHILHEEHDAPHDEDGDVTKDTSAMGLGPLSADASGAEYGVSVPVDSGDDSVADANVEKGNILTREGATVDGNLAGEPADPPASEGDVVSGAEATGVTTDGTAAELDFENVPVVASTAGEIAVAAAAEADIAPALAAPAVDEHSITHEGGDEPALNADPVPQQEEPPATQRSETHLAHPLKADASFASTVLDDDGTDNSSEAGVVQIIESGADIPEDANGETEFIQPTQTVGHEDGDAADPVVHGSPATSSSKTLASPGSSRTYTEVNHVVPAAKVDRKDTEVSANRLSISYAGGKRRLVVNASVVEKLKVLRADARIEVHLSVGKNDDGTLRGITMEGLSDETKSYLPLDARLEDDDVLKDVTIPPFMKAGPSTKLLILIHLDTVRPLSEPKWVKSGDIQDWLKTIFGGRFWAAGDAADGWERRIEVADPDPAPTIWTVLDSWAVNSPAGSVTERQRFLKTHMTETENVLEILLRLVRGERATPSQHGPAISAASVSGPLLATLNQGGAHVEQQNHVSLAVLAIFQMAVDFAKKAAGEEKGKKEAEERIGEIIRCLPSHLIYKSLDGIFKEWKGEKRRGGR